MKRIDPDEIAAWFKAHPDIKPIKNQFIITNPSNNQVTNCCGTTAYLLKERETDADLQDFDLGILEGGSATACRYLAQPLGLSNNYLLGFVHGWDNFSEYDYEPYAYTADYYVGREDGNAAYLASIRRP